MKSVINKTQSGFLLVELIVSVFIFTIVMVVTFGSIVTALDANRKTQSLEAVMNNLNLALDDITRSLAVGNNYQQSGDSISFISQDGETVTYQFHDLGSRGYISRQIGPSGREVRLTAYEINLQSGSSFTVVSSSGQQPRVEVFLKGVVQAGPRNSTEFTLQTLVSQRIPNFN